MSINVHNQLVATGALLLQEDKNEVFEHLFSHKDFAKIKNATKRIDK